MEVDRYEHGVPSWVDLGTPDIPKAIEFYAGLFGWQIEQGPPEVGGYSMAMYKGKPAAGIGPQMNPGPPYWTTYVSVDSADQALARARDAGGKVLMEAMDVMDVGRMGIIQDPIGAVISVWEPRAHIGAGIVNEPNTYGWSELVTTDTEASKPFYGAVFGWDSETHGEGGPMAYTEWKVGGRSVAGMMQKPPMMPAEVPPHWGVYFTVDGTEAAMDKVKELGGQVLMGPMDVEPGKIAVVQDPQGAVFNIITLAPQREQG
ncbi:MAG TPA: VOC family protein [Acidimicrobiia bacterium]|nr:VOC family protein [Acidimicrobiia bacterium]